MSIRIKHLTKEDLSEFASLIHLFNLVFEEESKIGHEANLRSLLHNKSFIALAALAEDEVVGGLTAYVLPLYYSDSSEIFLYDLAIKTEYQRMGIGKSLLQHLKGYCVSNRIKGFFVMAHEEDEHATGGKAERVVNFLYETGAE